jgi:hypothetical protein
MTDEAKGMVWGIGVEFVKTVGFPITVALVLLWIGREQMNASMLRESQFTTFVTTQLSESLSTTRELVQNNGAMITSLQKVVETKMEAIDKNTDAIIGLEQAIKQLSAGVGR